MASAAAMDGAVEAAIVTADMRVRCKQLGIAAATPTDDFLERCLCVMRTGNSGHNCTDNDRLTVGDQLRADNLWANASNATEPLPTEEPDNLINSDVFIYVIVFIVIVYFLTFLYLCMKKRQREAEDAGAAGETTRSRARNLEQDRPPAYEEVMNSTGAVGGKGSEPPTYAEVLARSQQLDQLDKAEQGAAS